MTHLSHTLVGLMAQTAIHAGASTNENLIDLPIQREAHSDWPVIVGSGVKGAWRAKAEVVFNNQPDVVTSIFGPDTDNASEHAGAIMVSDARLLLLPVRSLTSHFKWVTCPALIARFQRDKRRLGIDTNKNTSHDHNEDVPDNTAIVFNDKTDKLHLEEYRFDVQKGTNDDIIDELLSVMGDYSREDLTANLTIVSDDQFRYFCRAAIPVQAHIAIDSNTKTVKKGALWYEETLPAETLMYNCLSFSKSRSTDTRTSEDLAYCFNDGLINPSPYLQIGGNATVGMGWFTLTVVNK
jgi:CRISPR-associated protein Cmr4